MNKDNRITVRLSDEQRSTLQHFAEGTVNTSDAIRAMIDMETEKMDLLRARDTASCSALVAEIEDSRRILSDTVWKNVAYNPDLYKTDQEKKEVAAALKESADIIHDLFYHLAERIAP